MSKKNKEKQQWHRFIYDNLLNWAQRYTVFIDGAGINSQRKIKQGMNKLYDNFRKVFGTIHVSQKM